MKRTNRNSSPRSRLAESFAPGRLGRSAADAPTDAPSRPRAAPRSGGATIFAAGRGLRLAAVALALAACVPAEAPATESARIAEVLALEPGDRVADVGAGDGRWAVALARAVGPEGRVWATEVDAEEIDKIEERVEDEGLENVVVVAGDELDTGLPEGCCDAVLLRMVYHHFTDPASMRESLRRALRPAGLLAVIDIVPQTSWRELPDVPDRGGHGLSREALEVELTADGFEVVERHDEWNGDPDRYCVVFRRADRVAGAP